MVSEWKILYPEYLSVLVRAELARVEPSRIL